MKKAAAAQRLGVPEHEVTGVRSTPDGDVVTTHDGVQYLVTADQVLYYANHPENTAFPIFGRDETIEVVPYPVMTKGGAALQLGVPESEILDVRPHSGRVPADDGDLVVLADRRVLITRAGVQVPWLASDPDPDLDPEPALDEVPSGTVEQVLAWVGIDPERAARALEAERAQEKPRVGLTEKLEKLVIP